MIFKTTEKNDGSLKIEFTQDEIKLLNKQNYFVLDAEHASSFITHLTGALLRLRAKLAPQNMETYNKKISGDDRRADVRRSDQNTSTS